MTDNALAAFQHMADFPRPIEEITQSGTEYYFRYGGHSFSINERLISPEQGVIHSAFVYPGYGASLADLAQHFDEGQPYGDIPMVRYGSDEPGNAEFAPVLARLYKVVEDKHLNLDEIFNDVFSLR